MVAALLFVGLASLAAYAVEPAKTASRSFQRTLILPLGGAPVAAERQTLDLEAAHVTRLPRGALPAAFRGPPTARTGSLSPPVAFLELAPGGRLRPAAPPGLGCRPAEAYVAEHALKPAAAGASGSGAVAIVVFDCEPPMPAADLDLSARLGLLRPPAGLSLPVAAKRGIAWSRAAAAGARPDPVGAMVATSRRASRALTAARGSAPVSAAGPTSARTASSQAVVTTTSGARAAPAPSSARRLTSTTSGPQSSEPTSPGAAAESLEISIVGGDKQSGVVGQPFDEDLVVLVTRDDAPQGGVPVTWKVVTGRARLEPVDSTGIAGQASVQVVPQQAGTIEVTASLDADCTADKCVRFTLTATGSSPPPSRICPGKRTVDPFNQGPASGHVCSDFTLIVLVKCDGAPEGGVVVLWEVTEEVKNGSVKLPSSFPETNDPGTTGVNVTPTHVGDFTVTATVPPGLQQVAGTTVVFERTAENDGANGLSISKVAGDRQEAEVDTPFGKPLEVRVDRCEDLKEAGIDVIWQVAPPGTATLAPTIGTTGTSGETSTRVTPREAGAIEVTARLPDAAAGCPAGECVSFHLTATAENGGEPTFGISRVGDRRRTTGVGSQYPDLVVEVAALEDGSPPEPPINVFWTYQEEPESGDPDFRGQLPSQTMTDPDGRARRTGLTPNSAGRALVRAKLDQNVVDCPQPKCVEFRLIATSRSPPSDLCLLLPEEPPTNPVVDEPFDLQVRVVATTAQLQQSVFVDWSFEVESGSPRVTGLVPETVTEDSGIARQSDLRMTSEGTVTITAKLRNASDGCPPKDRIVFRLSSIREPGLPEIVTVAPELALRLAEVNLGQVLARLAALRRGGPELATEFAALEIQGVRLPIDALASLGGRAEEPADGLEIAGLLSGEERGGAAGKKSRGRGRLGMFVSGIIAFGDRQGAPDAKAVEAAVEGQPQDLEGVAETRTREAGFDFHTNGLMVGMDYDFDDFVAGGAVSFVSTGSDLDEAAGAVDVEGLHLAAYLLLVPKPRSDEESLYLDAVLSFGRNDFDQWRKGPLESSDPAGRTDGVARASFGGDQLALHLGGGYERNWKSLVAGGFASLSYVAAETEAYEEASTDKMWLVEVERQKLTSLLASLGVDLSYYTWLGGGVLAPSLRVAYRSELADDSRRIAGRFDGSLIGVSDELRPFPDDFQTERPDRGYFNVALSLLGNFRWGAVAIGYDRDLARSDFDLAAITLGARFAF